MPTDDLDRFCCQNPDCRLHGRRGPATSSSCDHFGKARHRLLYCRACKARFSEFKGTPLFNSKLPHEKVLSVLEHLAEGCGVRQTARLVGVNKDTVTRLALLAGGTPRTPTMSSWLFPPETREVQFDEKWSFVAKKQTNCDPDDPADDHCGDYWDFVAYDPEHRLVLAVIPGARTEENAEAIVGEADARLGGAPPELITSDELPAYETAIEATFGEPVPAPRSGSRAGPGSCRAAVARRRGLRHGAQAPGEGSGRRGGAAAGLRVGEGAGGGPGESRVSVPGEHVVPGAAERGRPGPQREEGPQDVSVQQGMGGP